MTAPVDELAERRARKVAAWNPETRRHAWSDVPGDPCPACNRIPDGEHLCGHCGIVYHSAPDGGRYVKHWRLTVDGEERRGRLPAMGKCPGPQRHLTVVASMEGGSEPASVPPSLAANEGAVPVTPAAVASPAPIEVADLPACTRCVPPCGRTGHPTLGGPTCDEGRAVVAEKRAAHLVELRSATSGMGVPTWRGGAA